MTRNDTIAFLTCVLPPEGDGNGPQGFYCATIFASPHPKPGVDKPRHKFVSTIEDLADVILAADAGNHTAYHACASFVEPTRRTGANARAVRSLWVDVDAGPDKPYSDAEEAAAAVVSFCRAADLPLPLFVGSGRGVHAYWPFDQPLDPQRWLQFAQGLKAACFAHGLKIDPARTADISSILRTPGTHWRKEREQLVRTDVSTSRPGRVASFESLFRYGPGTATRVRAVGVPATSKIGRRSISASIESGTSYGAVYADDIADRCGQVGALRQSGNIEEPRWYACLGVLARCEDGRVKAHEWSQNDYPGYNAAAVDDRLQRSQLLSGATTCERLHALEPAICERCVFHGRINSPISIPSGISRGVHATATERQRTASVAGQRPAPDESVDDLPYLPEGYRWSSIMQLLFVTENPDGQSTSVVVTEHPVYLKSVQTGELDGTMFSYRFTKRLPKEGWTDVLIDARALFGNGGVADLFGKGVVIHEPKLFLIYVRHAVDNFHKETETRVRYDQFGWKNGNSSFLYGKMLYTSAGPIEAIGAKEVETRSQWIGPRKGGNVEAWTEAADALFASDMEAYSAMVLASFAAPLMRFQSQDEGGAILHLFTPGSGQGKTTALNAAWTVWGTKEGLALTNEDTRVSKPIAIGTLANLPVIYDELRDKDPEYIRRMVVMFTEGRDRMRGMVDGTIRHTKANWQTIMLSAANTSLIDQLQGDGVDAPAFRVLEMSSTLSQKIDKTKGDRLKRIMNENAGHAGDAYLRYLLHPPVLEYALRSLDQWTQEIWDTTRLDSAHRFRVRAVGAIAVASSLVDKLGILHFNTNRIVEWLLRELGTGKNTGTVSASMPAESAINALGAFINEHFGEMLVVRHEWRPRKEKQMPLQKPQHRLSIRYEIEPQRLFVSDTVFKDWALKKQFSPRSILETLEKSLVVTNRRRGITLSAGTDIPGAQVMCIEINAAHPTVSGLVAGVSELQQDKAS